MTCGYDWPGRGACDKAATYEAAGETLVCAEHVRWAIHAYGPCGEPVTLRLLAPLPQPGTAGNPRMSDLRPPRPVS